MEIETRLTFDESDIHGVFICVHETSVSVYVSSEQVVELPFDLIDKIHDEVETERKARRAYEAVKSDE